MKNFTQNINNNRAIINNQINFDNMESFDIDYTKYPNWLVPLDAAKKLKDLGFNKSCIFSYSEGFGITACLRIGASDEPSISDFIIGGNTPNSPLTDLPTFEQAFDWFRSKGFYITLENHKDSTKFMFYNMKINEGKHFKGEFSSYEETREVLVNKLIEVYGKSI